MAARKPSGAAPKPAQETPSEGAQPQVDAPETDNGAVQETDMARIRDQLLADETFIDSVLQTPAAQRRLQSDRDRSVHEATLPFRRQLEDMQTQLAESTRANDPVWAQYQKLKDDGDYEAALQLLENRQAQEDASARARMEGERQAGQSILQRIAARPEYADLTDDDWRGVYANAATAATQEGRQVSVDEYIAVATRAARQKEREMAEKERTDNDDQRIKDAIEARLKELGISAREETGGPEEIEGGKPSSGKAPTDEEVVAMSQDDWEALPDETRKIVLARAAKMLE